MILASIFRDSEDYIPRFAGQVDALAQHVSDLRLVLAYGDCSDDTGEALDLALENHDVTLLHVDHGGPKYASVDLASRWTQIAIVCNAVMNAIRHRVQENEPVVYVESDLVWDVPTICSLLDSLTACDAIAPLSLSASSDKFFDTWGHVKDGLAFRPTPPYHPAVNGQITEIDSAGSCVVMRAEVAKVVRFGEWDCIRGLGRSIRECGYTLWLDPSLAVRHP